MRVDERLGGRSAEMHLRAAIIVVLAGERRVSDVGSAALVGAMILLAHRVILGGQLLLLLVDHVDARAVTHVRVLLLGVVDGRLDVGGVQIGAATRASAATGLGQVNKASSGLRDSSHARFQIGHG